MMNNPMDKFQFQSQSIMTPNQAQYQSPNIFDIVNQAKQNPKAFEEQFRKNNPQAYQRALNIRNSFNNPQEIVLQMAQQRGINPNIIKMFNL